MTYENVFSGTRVFHLAAVLDYNIGGFIFGRRLKFGSGFAKGFLDDARLPGGGNDLGIGNQWKDKYAQNQKKVKI